MNVEKNFVSEKCPAKFRGDFSRVPISAIAYLVNLFIQVFDNNNASDVFHVDMTVLFFQQVCVILDNVPAASCHSFIVRRLTVGCKFV